MLRASIPDVCGEYDFDAGHLGQYACVQCSGTRRGGWATHGVSGVSDNGESGSGMWRVISANMLDCV